MSWIQENKFTATLLGGTLIGALLILFVGYQGNKRYNGAKEQFEAAAAEASGFEKLALYPTNGNRDGKRKSLEEYRVAVDGVQKAFAPYRPAEVTEISPQEFTDHLLTANSDIRKAFEDAGATLPEEFFVGFERYKTALAPGKTTGILDYQLAAVKKILMALAAAKPSELKNIHRPTLAEEEGQVYTPAPTEVARELPLEISFLGPERSLREFLSAIGKLEGDYTVVRTIKISNDKMDPPRIEDAKFEKETKAAKPAEVSDIFSVDPLVTPDPAGDKPAPVDEVKPVDTGRILSQVLGNERVKVFVRLDVLRFLPEKKLP